MQGICHPLHIKYIILKEDLPGGREGFGLIPCLRVAGVRGNSQLDWGGFKCLLLFNSIINIIQMTLYTCLLLGLTCIRQACNHANFKDTGNA